MATWFGRFARAASEIAGSAWAFILAFLVIIIRIITGPAFRFSNTWQLVVNTATTIVTFLMVFLIQNAQNRDAKALHLKIDELIVAHKGARNRMIDLEKLSDEQLAKLESEYQRICEEASQGVQT
jgi:low affinity Fe/Cu permease